MLASPPVEGQRRFAYSETVHIRRDLLLHAAERTFALSLQSESQAGLEAYPRPPFRGHAAGMRFDLNYRNVMLPCASAVGCPAL